MFATMSPFVPYVPHNTPHCTCLECYHIQLILRNHELHRQAQGQIQRQGQIQIQVQGQIQIQRQDQIRRSVNNPFPKTYLAPPQEIVKRKAYEHWEESRAMDLRHGVPRLDHQPIRAREPAEHKEVPRQWVKPPTLIKVEPTDVDVEEWEDEKSKDFKTEENDNHQLDLDLGHIKKEKKWKDNKSLKKKINSYIDDDLTYAGEMIEIGGGIKISRTFDMKLRLNHSTNPAIFLRRLFYQGGVFSLEEIASSSITGKRTPHSPAEARPALDQEKFTILKDYTIACCGLKPKTAEMLKFEARLKCLCTEARKLLKKIQAESS